MKTLNLNILNFRDKTIMETVRQVKEENKNISDFDSISLIDNILKNLRILYSEEKIEKLSFSNKNRLKTRLQRKRDFINHYLYFILLCLKNQFLIFSPKIRKY